MTLRKTLAVKRRRFVSNMAKRPALAAGLAACLAAPAVAAPLISGAVAGGEAAPIVTHADAVPAQRAPASRLMGMLVLDGDSEGWVHHVDVDETGRADAITVARKTMLGLNTERYTVSADRVHFVPDAELVLIDTAAG